MEYKYLQEKYVRCCQLVIQQQLHEAFTLLQELINDSRNTDFALQLEKNRDIYQNILKYSFGEVEDPDKKAVYFRLLRSTIELADEVREYTLVTNKYLDYSAIKQEQVANTANLSVDVKASLKKLHSAKHDNSTLQSLFHQIWLTDKYQDPETELVAAIIQSGNIPWWNKCLMVSALTLSLQRYFDETKFNLLIEAYKQSEEQVWQRALVGLFIALYQYNQRLLFYPKLKERLEALQANSLIEQQLERVMIQFIKARDTEKIAKRFREEIFPEMARIQNRIYDKIDLKDLIQDQFSEDKNPDWEHVFHDSPGLLNKLEEFSMLQVDGSDVFMSTFSMLKDFDFFRSISNWFIPFHKESQLLAETLHDGTISFNADEFSENMEQSSILCNSDKYSFCLNIKRMPSRERTMMVEMFNMEIKAMEEADKDDELLQKSTRERNIVKQYIQDLYRFHKIYAFKDEFYDIFATNTDFHNTHFFHWIFKDETITRNIGEFLFEKGHYEDAIEIFVQMDTQPGNFELWQKIAYSYQQQGNYEKALEYYLRADLTDIRKSWNIKKIGLCYRRLGNYPKALEYYNEAAKMEPDNLQVQTNLAHSFFDMKDYDNALKIYFKLEYLAPDNHKIQRPIAWCSFMLGKLETAKKYYEKIVSKEGNQHDLLNIGHIEWCLGNKQKAIDCYLQSIRKADFNDHWFSEELIADSEMLIRYGIDRVDISLMKEYIKILADREQVN